MHKKNALAIQWSHRQPRTATQVREKKNVYEILLKETNATRFSRKSSTRVSILYPQHDYHFPHSISSERAN